jgi:hypothetical protein
MVGKVGRYMALYERKKGKTDIVELKMPGSDSNTP